jgi:hypothetical protein
MGRPLPCGRRPQSWSPTTLRSEERGFSPRPSPCGSLPLAHFDRLYLLTIRQVILDEYL